MFEHLPRKEAGCRMPSANTIIEADRVRQIDAVEGSRKLLKAIRDYFVRGGRA